MAKMKQDSTVGSGGLAVAYKVIPKKDEKGNDTKEVASIESTMDMYLETLPSARSGIISTTPGVDADSPTVSLKHSNTSMDYIRWRAAAAPTKKDADTVTLNDISFENSTESKGEGAAGGLEKTRFWFKLDAKTGGEISTNTDTGEKTGSVLYRYQIFFGNVAKSSRNDDASAGKTTRETTLTIDIKPQDDTFAAVMPAELNGIISDFLFGSGAGATVDYGTPVIDGGEVWYEGELSATLAEV